jgi:hypothetical protein
VSTLYGDAPCADCGTSDNIIWWTDSVFWNAVCPPNDGSPILCVPCFIERSEARGFRPNAWKVTPDWPWFVATPESERHREIVGNLQDENHRLRMRLYELDPEHDATDWMPS